MNLSVTSRHIDVSVALRDRTEARLEELFSKYFGKAISATVTFVREGQGFKSNLDAHVGRSIHMNASAHHQDAYLALDAAAQNLAKRLRRHKRRLRDDHTSHQNEAQRLEATNKILAGYDTEMASLDSDDNLPDEQPLIIAEINASIKTMTVADAVTELDLTEEAAVMFTNAKTGRTNMLYRRNDGHLGWLEPLPRKI